MERYEVIKKIGEGQFGKVHKGRWKYTGQIVALKFINTHGRSAKDMETLYKEVKVLRELRHPNIILLLDAFQTDREYCLVTEYAQGELFSVVNEDRTLPEPDVQGIAKQLVRALDFLHSNRIIHRDMKPQNILISAQGVIKLCDFGFARTMSTLTIMVKSIKGTPLYMAPELIHETPYNHTVDLWSLGVILYELYAGYAPFHGRNIFELFKVIVDDQVKYPSDMTAEFKQFLQGLLTKEKDKRLTWPNLRHHIFVCETEAEREARETAHPSTLSDPQTRLNMFLGSQDTASVPKTQGARKSSAPPLHLASKDAFLGRFGLPAKPTNLHSGVTQDYPPSRKAATGEASGVGHQRRSTYAGNDAKWLLDAKQTVQNTAARTNGHRTDPNLPHANPQTVSDRADAKAAKGEHSAWTATMLMEWNQLESIAQREDNCSKLRGDSRFAEKLFQAFKYNCDYVFEQGELFLCAALRTLVFVATKGNAPLESDGPDARVAGKEVSDVVMHPHLMPTMLYMLNLFHESRPKTVLAEVVRAIRVVYRERLAHMLEAKTSGNSQEEQRVLVDISIQMIRPLAGLVTYSGDPNLTVNAQTLKCLGVILGFCSSIPSSCREVYKAMTQHSVPAALCRCVGTSRPINAAALPSVVQKLSRFATHALSLLVHPYSGSLPQVMKFPLAYRLNDHDEYHSDVSLWHGGTFTEGTQNMLRERELTLGSQTSVGEALRTSAALALCEDGGEALRQLVSLLAAQLEPATNAPEDRAKWEEGNISRIVLTNVVLLILTQVCESDLRLAESGQGHSRVAAMLVELQGGVILDHAMWVVHEYLAVLWSFDEVIRAGDDGQPADAHRGKPSSAQEDTAREVLQERMSPNVASNAALAMLLLAHLLPACEQQKSILYTIHNVALDATRLICTCSAQLEEKSEQVPELEFDRNGCLLVLPAVCALLRVTIVKIVDAELGQSSPSGRTISSQSQNGLASSETQEDHNQRETPQIAHDVASQSARFDHDDGKAQTDGETGPRDSPNNDLQDREFQQHQVAPSVNKDSLVETLIPREVLVATHRLLVVLCDRSSEGSSCVSMFSTEGSAYGVRCCGMADVAAGLLLDILDVTARAGPDAEMKAASAIVEFGLLDLVLEQVCAGKDIDEFSPNGLLLALDVVYRLVSYPDSDHLSVHLLSDGGNSNNGCAGLVPVLELLHASHLNRLVTWPVAYGGGVQGVGQVFRRVVRLAELPFVSAQRISKRDFKLIQVTLYERRVVRRVIRALAHSTSKDFSEELMNEVFDLLARLVIYEDAFARQFVESGGIAMIKELELLRFTVKTSRDVTSDSPKHNGYVYGEKPSRNRRRTGHAPSDRVIKNVLLVLSKLARSSSTYYDKIISCDFNEEWRALLGHHNPVLRFKTCNLIGNMCKHSDQFYRPLVKPLPPVPPPLYQPSALFPASLLPKNSSRHDLLFHLVARAQDCDPETRRYASFAIGNAAYYSEFLYRDLRTSIAILAQLLEDRNPKTRANAAGGLGNMVRNSGTLCEDIVECGVVEKMVQMAQEDPCPAQRRALFSLGNLCAYQQCREVLGKMEAPTFEEVIRNLLQNTNDETTAEYIGRLQEKLSQPAELE